MTFDFFFGVRDGGTTSKRYFEFFLDVQLSLARQALITGSVPQSHLRTSAIWVCPAPSELTWLPQSSSGEMANTFVDTRDTYILLKVFIYPCMPFYRYLGHWLTELWCSIRSNPHRNARLSCWRHIQPTLLDKNRTVRTDKEGSFSSKGPCLSYSVYRQNVWSVLICPHELESEPKFCLLIWFRFIFHSPVQQGHQQLSGKSDENKGGCQKLLSGFCPLRAICAIWTNNDIKRCLLYSMLRFILFLNI